MSTVGCCVVTVTSRTHPQIDRDFIHRHSSGLVVPRRHCAVDLWLITLRTAHVDVLRDEVKYIHACRITFWNDRLSLIKFADSSLTLLPLAASVSNTSGVWVSVWAYCVHSTTRSAFQSFVCNMIDIWVYTTGNRWTIIVIIIMPSAKGLYQCCSK